MVHYFVIIYSDTMAHTWHPGNAQTENQCPSLYKVLHINIMKRLICLQRSGIQDGSKL
jgi:hypothetical protein